MPGTAQPTETVEHPDSRHIESKWIKTKESTTPADGVSLYTVPTATEQARQKLY